VGCYSWTGWEVGSYSWTGWEVGSYSWTGWEVGSYLWHESHDALHSGHRPLLVIEPRNTSDFRIVYTVSEGRHQGSFTRTAWTHDGRDTTWETGE
jgi:hypothetical protein